MKILVLNCGSSSLKYQFINMLNETVLSKGLCERIGTPKAVLKHESPKEISKEMQMNDHKEAIKHVIDILLDSTYGVITNTNEVFAVGHRVVHGGEFFNKSAIITEEIYKAIEDCSSLAPLHNPSNLMGIDACSALLPSVGQVAVFDTAFHQTMPEKAFLYALPISYYEKYKIRRYGFHGTSHKYVSAKVAEFIKKPIESLKIITCHLGNGASLCAINNGKSVDTSMGFTPLEGLVMGTRSGDLDPAIIPYLCNKENMSPKEVENMLNKNSGVFGLSSGISHDFRDLENAAADGDENAKNALDVYFYRVAKYIGQYTAVLNGVDIIVFTAGLGENSSYARQSICSYLGYLGIALDSENNEIRGKIIKISTDNSTTDVYVVPTNEELVIARDTKSLLG